MFWEEKLIFLPWHSPFGMEPGDLEAFPGKEVNFTSLDGTGLHGVYLSQAPRSKILLFHHGNAGDLTFRLDHIQRFWKRGWSVFLYDYRGYGQSEGRPSEKGVYLDSRAAYRYVREYLGYEPEEIVLFGRSLGGAVAIDLALQNPCRLLIVEATFTKLAHMRRRFFPLPSEILGLRSRFDSLNKISRIQVPHLFIHGDRDPLVPLNLGWKLYQRAPGPKSFISVPGASHNDVYLVGGVEYFNAIERFIKGSDFLSPLAGKE